MDCGAWRLSPPTSGKSGVASTLSFRQTDIKDMPACNSLEPLWFLGNALSTDACAMISRARHHLRAWRLHLIRARRPAVAWRNAALTLLLVTLRGTRGAFVAQHGRTHAAAVATPTRDTSMKGEGGVPFYDTSGKHDSRLGYNFLEQNSLKQGTVTKRQNATCCLFYRPLVCCVKHDCRWNIDACRRSYERYAQTCYSRRGGRTPNGALYSPQTFGLRLLSFTFSSRRLTRQH